MAYAAKKALCGRVKSAEVRAPGNDGNRSVFGTWSQLIDGDDSPHSNRRGKNAFKAQRTNELDEAQKLAKTVNGILNKLTPEKYDALAHQLCDPALQILVKKEYMHKTIELIFARAVTQDLYAGVFAHLAALICGKEVELRESESEGRNKSMFRRLLLEVVQKEFEKRNDKDEDEDEESLKKKRLGNINFIGELYNTALLTDNVICMVIETLLFSSTPPEPRTAHRPAPEELEELIRLLTTIGRVLDHRAKKSSSERLNENKTKAFFTQIQALSCESMYKMRIKIMLVNTIDLRSQGWPQKVQTAKKLNELEKENEEKDRRKYVSSELDLCIENCSTPFWSCVEKKCKRSKDNEAKKESKDKGDKKEEKEEKQAPPTVVPGDFRQKVWHPCAHPLTTSPIHCSLTSTHHHHDRL